MTTRAIVPGSLGAIAAQSGQSLAQSFMHADAIVVVDTSASMAERDVAGETTRTRYRAACDELKALQAQHPGKVAVISFSTVAVFCPGGVPENLSGGTDIARALEYIKPADGLGLKLILISDGEPQDADAALAVARTFSDPIQTIYIGSGSGRAFLERLAKLTGGTAAARAIPQLAASIAGLIADKVA